MLRFVANNIQLTDEFSRSRLSLSLNALGA